jgi:ribosomal protein S18 acetylase RimI-like enzyme
MPSIIIRKAKLKEVGEISKLHKKLAEYHHRLDNFYSSKINSKRYIRKVIKQILVAELEGKIVGFIIFRIKKHPAYSEKITHISDLYVDEKYRKLGIGKKLVEEIIKLSKSKKVKYITITVHCKNEIGLKFWKKLGFEEYSKNMRLKL